ncbi:MAG: adenosylcobinamide-GDP ribazoletransferase [Chloroflexi bacterium]|nr:adenosylcobinamide-GDP ribazoletransferase [Chloroflexota bacterium]
MHPTLTERVAARLRDVWAACWAAGSMLTVVPWPAAPESLPPERRARSLACYPAIGLGLGLGLWAFARVASILLGPTMAGWLLAPLLALLTGGFHLDGLMDAADGLFGGHTPEERLRIMRDERVGAFGVTAALVVFGTKMAALGTGVPWQALLLAPMWARWAAVWAVVRYPYAREQGLGHGLKAYSRPRDLAFATGFAVVVSLLLAPGWAFGLITLLLVHLFVYGLGERVPGLTGDLYGALIEIVETVLWVLAHSPLLW